MTKDEFVAQVDRAAQTMPALPVTSALLRHLSESIKAGDPAWWQKTLKAWEKRRFVAWSEAWGLFLTAVHFEALNNAENPLVPYFPSCGGTDEADPSSAFAKFLEAPPASFFEHLRTGHRRSYIAPRAVLWMSPALFFFQHKRQLPFYLVEVNAGAGLDLAADLVYPTKGFSSDLISARIGLDPEPLQLEDILHRRWATAAANPDSLSSITEFDHAADLLLERQAKEAAFVQTAACSAQDAPSFLAKNIPSDDPDSGLFVFNMGTTVRMTDPEYEKYKAGMLEMLKPWKGRGLWMEVESVRGELYSSTYHCRVNRIVDGSAQQHTLATIDFSAGNVALDLKANWKFLATKASLP